MKTVRVKQGMWKYWYALGEEEQADFEVDDLNAVIELFGWKFENN
jgi:8-oxo-dGTP diphosphatase/putative hydrolase of the HAD superfamily